MPENRKLSTVEQIKRENANIGNHWFEPDTMRFFRSRVLSGVYHHATDPNRWNYFITSERYSDQAARKYTIRQMLPDGSIETISAFMQYSSADSARRALKRMLATEPTPER